MYIYRQDDKGTDQLMSDKEICPRSQKCAICIPTMVSKTTTVFASNVQHSRSTLNSTTLMENYYIQKINSTNSSELSISTLV